jgi:hypothetical protein
VVSPVPLILQDKEGSGSDISHEENVIFIFEDSRPFAPINYSMKSFDKSLSCNNLLEKSEKKTSRWTGLHRNEMVLYRIDDGLGTALNF